MAACKNAAVDVKNNKDELLTIPLRMSVGIACSSEVEVDKIYALADERMYAEKQRFYAEKEKEKMRL